MAVTIVSTPSAANANSYEEVAEASAYFEARVALDPAWDDADNKEALLVMGTRVLDAAFRGYKTFVPAMGSIAAFYRIGRKWTGLPSTTVQRLAWPRTGMFDQNGNAIAVDAIPQDLKDALSELAGQLGLTDRTLDNQVAVQGITSVKAGSVSVSFKDGYIASAVLPQAVIDLIPPSWYTEEILEGAMQFDFGVVL